MITLTKSRTVMTLMQASGPWIANGEAVSEGEAIFERWEDDRRRTLSLEWDAWRDMGEPSTITITIEPGDLLND